MPEGLIVGNSTMAELVRRFAWEKTPLGPVSAWSETLLSQVNLMLCSPFPATLTWGAAQVYFYNDAAIPSMATKHPDALGRKAAEIFAESWHIFGSEREACFLRGEAPIRENVQFPMLCDGRLKDVYFTYSLTPIYEHGKIVGVRGVHEDTTEKVEARLERDSLAGRLAQVLDATSDGVVSIDESWVITYMNARCMQILQTDPGVIGTNTWISFPHQIYPGSPYVKYMERAMFERVAGSFEAFYPEPLNIHVHLEVRPARDGIVVFVRDITEQKQMEKQLNEAHARERESLLELFEEAPAFVAALSGPEHVFEMANASYRHMLGNRELIGRRVIDCIPEVKETGWIEILDEVYRTGVPHAARGAQLLLAPRPGEPLEERIVDYVYQPRRTPDGTVCGIIAQGIDVTERERAEKALIQNEKLVAVGRLASSIAHEINNPLAGALSYLYLAGVSDNLVEVRECINLAEVELRRVSVISTQTLLSQKQSTVPSSTSFQELTESILHLYQGRIKVSQIKISTRHRPARPMVCLEGEIRQALGNLIGNAIDAMSGRGGRLLLRSQPATDWKTGRRGHRMTIADTGSGIPLHIQKSIFDPFFTTKGSLGNGLGLWITREIMARHAGTIRLRSRVGAGQSGSVFTLFLPESDS